MLELELSTDIISNPPKHYKGLTGSFVFTEEVCLLKKQTALGREQVHSSNEGLADGISAQQPAEHRAQVHGRIPAVPLPQACMVRGVRSTCACITLFSPLGLCTVWAYCLIWLIVSLCLVDFAQAPRGPETHGAKKNKHY